MTELERAEQFKRLFVDPAVEAMCEKMKGQIAPVLAKLETLAQKDGEHDARLARLESRQSKALIGFAVYASAASIVVGATWDWLKRKVGMGGN